MTPEMQQLLQQAQQNLEVTMQAAQRQAQIVFYTTWFSIMICAVFAVLIFWKLCQIHKQLLFESAMRQPIPPEPASLESVSPSNPRPMSHDESRYMPKQ